MSNSPDYTYMSRSNIKRQDSEQDYNTIENLFPKAIEKLINKLRSKLSESVKERITDFGKLPQPNRRSLSRRPAVRGPRKIKFITWDRINPSYQNTIIKTADEILSSEEKGYAGDLTVFMEKTWPLISDPEKFKLFKQRVIEDGEQITKSAFNPDEFQSMFGAHLGRQKTPSPSPSTSPLALGKRTRGKKPPANKKKRKYFSKKKRKSKTKK